MPRSGRVCEFVEGTLSGFCGSQTTTFRSEPFLCRWSSSILFFQRGLIKAETDSVRSNRSEWWFNGS